jgi:5-oxoprolinase (ATP-hydrolysing)/N-methylhydantoinase A
VIQRKELLPGSGGAGRYRGGLGQRIEVTTSDSSPFQLFAVFDRVDNPARGRAGGEPGAPGRVSTLNGVPLRPKGQQAIAAGDGVRIDTPGGAGFGPPADRNPELAAHDAEQGYVDE